MSRFRTRFHAAGVSAVALAWVLAAGSGHADPGAPSSAPAVLDRDALLAWLAEQTDISPRSVVAVSHSAVTSLMQARPSREGPGRMTANIRAEALNPPQTGLENVLSWHAEVELDCRQGRTRMGRTLGYAERNLLGEGREIRPADTTWRAPAPNTHLHNVLQAACHPDEFVGPLQAGAPAAPSAEDRSAPAPDQPPPQKPEPAPARPAPPPQPAPAQPAPAPKPAPVQPAPAPKPPPARPAAQPVPAAERARVSVQIAASDTEAQARQALQRARTRFGTAVSGLEGQVVQAEVRGRTYHRAVFVGFRNRAEANALCQTFKAGGVECFVRGDLGR